jgi:predicted N-acetyltransferase YhbS
MERNRLVRYLDTAADLAPAQLEGFFVGWPDPPTAATLLRILQGSTHVVLAQETLADGNPGAVIGYITALSDGLSAAYIPHLEVRPDWQQQGIGQELVRRMLAKLRNIYMIDLVCDPALMAYYERFGFRPYHAMIVRNYERQSCN